MTAVFFGRVTADYFERQAVDKNPHDRAQLLTH